MSDTQISHTISRDHTSQPIAQQDERCKSTHQCDAHTAAAADKHNTAAEADSQTSLTAGLARVLCFFTGFLPIALAEGGILRCVVRRVMCQRDAQQGVACVPVRALWASERASNGGRFTPNPLV